MAKEDYLSYADKVDDFELSYSFTPSKNRDAHYHDFYQIVLLNSGKTTYLVEGRKYILTKNTLMLLSPNQIHLEKVSEKYSAEKFVFSITSEYLSQISSEKTPLSAVFEKASAAKLHTLELNDCQRDCLLAILQNVQKLNEKNFGQDIYRQIYAQEFLIELSNAYAENNVECTDEKNLIETISDYVCANLTLDLKVDTIASQFFVNKFHLAHKFKSETGMTLHKFIMEKRLIYAKELLSTGCFVKDVYVMCGFSDYSNFFRAFKERFSCTPKEYCKQVNNK